MGRNIQDLCKWKTKRGNSGIENIAYDLDSSILVLQLNSESLLLHTIIYYDEEDKTFYYYPFSKRGVRPAPASFINGQLIVQSSETKRFVFGSTDDGGFREYGEVLTNGKWVKYFQDDFTEYIKYSHYKFNLCIFGLL